MMDAVPVTLGQEFGGYAAQMRLGRERVESALDACRADTARRNRDRHGAQHAPRVRRARARPSCGEHERARIAAPADPFEAQANRDSLVELRGALKVVAVSLTKIANDLVLMGSGPRTGFVELRLPELQKGSSIMPGKVNPVIPEVVLQVAAQVIGNDMAVTVAGTQGAFEINVRIPMMARNVLQSIAILSSAAGLLADKCVAGLEANEEQLRHYAESTPAIATALNPHIGYDRGTEIVNEAVEQGRTIREVALEKGVDEETLDRGARPAGDGPRQQALLELQGIDAPRDLVARRADLVERPALRVREIPVDVALARDVRALVAAAHRHDHVGPFAPARGSASAARGRRGRSRARASPRRPPGARARRACVPADAGRVAAAGGALEQRLAHLRAPGVMQADEEDVIGPSACALAATSW